MTDQELPAALNPDEAADLEHLFRYHAPAAADVARMYLLREKAKELAYLLVEHCPRSADRTAALRHLRECVMTANASIVLGGRNLR